jgi:hypothetical protein
MHVLSSSLALARHAAEQPAAAHSARACPPAALSRRTLTAGAASLLLCGGGRALASPAPSLPPAAAFTRFVDADNVFSLLVPTGWTQVRARCRLGCTLPVRSCDAMTG